VPPITGIMTSKKDPNITIIMGGKEERLTLHAFLKVVRETLDILNGMEQRITGQEILQLNWEILDISKSSPVSLTLSAGAPKGSRLPARKVVEPFYKGLRTINRQARKPRFFDNQLLQKTKRLSSPLKDGVDFIEFVIEGEQPLRLSSRVIDNVERLTGKTSRFYYADSCHEGILEIIDVHGRKPEFFIFDRLTRDGIRCYCDPEITQKLGSTITRRIRVFGETKYRRKDHKPLSITVSSYAVIRPNDELPQIGDLHKEEIDITRGQRSEDFVGELRDAE